MKKNIIAICGAKRCGKDVISQYIVDKHGYTKIAFADPLKNIVKSIFDFNDIQVGIDEINCIGHEKDTIDDKWGISPRQALQFFGTEILQYKIQELLPNINKNFLSNKLCNKIEDDKNYVISDLRFIHEYERLKELKMFNLFIIRILRSSENMDNNKPSIDNHISEKEFLNIPYDIEIVNDSSIEEYFLKYDKYHSTIFQKILR
jgi:hypothetical protein